MATPTVVVLDHGSGNLRSAQRALEKVGAAVEVTADFDTVLAADGLVVPGVGAFGAVMAGMNAVRGPRLIDKRLAGGRPVLGICVGMQVMFDRGIEHGVDTEGLGEWPGVVEELDAPVIPHMGWNTIEAPSDSVLFAGLHDARFYFVHSYGVRTWELVDTQSFALPLVTWSTHGTPFVAAVENGPLAATQFHPEKSGDAGLTLLEHWVHTLG
jgi:glutamine amidotransferase